MICHRGHCRKHKQDDYASVSAAGYPTSIYCVTETLVKQNTSFEGTRTQGALQFQYTVELPRRMSPR